MTGGKAHKKKPVSRRLSLEASSSSSPRLSGIRTELGGGGPERSLGMERLSKNLCLEIFRLLDYTSLAAAAHACREWRRLASDDELWSELFKKRWGSDCAASYAPRGSKSWKDVYAERLASEADTSWYRLFKQRWGSGNAVFYAPRGSKSWKDAYEAHDRCDLLDLDFKLIRKGGDYYVVRGDYIHKYVPSGEGAKLPPGIGDRK